MYPRHDANHFTCTHFGAWIHTCMLREIKGIISGHLVYNHKAYNYEQGWWEIRRARGKIISWTPMMSFSNYKNWKQAKALRIPVIKGPYALHLPDIDCVLLNFWLFAYFSNLGLLVSLGPRACCLPHSVALIINAFMWWHFFLSILCFLKQLIDTWFMQQS